MYKRQDFTDSVDVKVNAPSVSVESVKIEGADIVNMGKTITLRAVITPENGEVTETTWSSDNENIATVDENGVVTGVSEGFATISVTINGNKTASHDIMVVDASSEKPMHTLSLIHILHYSLHMHVKNKPLKFPVKNMDTCPHKSVLRIPPNLYMIELSDKTGG